MWPDEDDLGEMYEGGNGSNSAADYRQLLRESDVDVVAPLGGPENEKPFRVHAAITHYIKSCDYSSDSVLIAPEIEAGMIDQSPLLGGKHEVIVTPGMENRWDEIGEMEEVLDEYGLLEDCEIHFFTSDYSHAQDSYITGKELPETEVEYFAMKTPDRLLKPFESSGRKQFRRLQYWIKELL